MKKLFKIEYWSKDDSCYVKAGFAFLDSEDDFLDTFRLTEERDIIANRDKPKVKGYEL